MLIEVSHENVIGLSSEVRWFVSWSLSPLLTGESRVVSHVMCGHLLHFLENVRVLNVVRQGIYQRIVVVGWDLKHRVRRLRVIFPTHRKLILHIPIKIIPVHLLFLLLPLFLQLHNLLRGFSMLLIVVIFFRKIIFFSWLKHFPFLNLTSQLLFVKVLFLQFTHPFFVLVVLRLLHLLLNCVLDVRLFQLVPHLVRRDVWLWVVIVGLHEHLVVLS